MKSNIGFFKIARSKQRKRSRGRWNTKKKLHCPLVSKSCFFFQTLMKLILKLTNLQATYYEIELPPKFCEELSGYPPLSLNKAWGIRVPYAYPVPLVDKIMGGTHKRPWFPTNPSQQVALWRMTQVPRGKIGHGNTKWVSCGFYEKCMKIHLNITLILFGSFPVLQQVWQDTGKFGGKSVRRQILGANSESSTLCSHISL